MELKVIYEDASCIVVRKPQGIVSEDAGSGSLPFAVRAYLSGKGERDELYPVHRLDKVTGGAILYARTREAAAYLSELVARHGIGKRYLTVLDGVPTERAGRLSDFLYHDKRQNKVFVVKSGRKGAKEAILDYRVLQTAEYKGREVALLEVTLLTGRTHQIRAQFSSRKTPVLGDRRYGSRETLTGGVIALWSHALSFVPYGMKETCEAVSLPKTEDVPWSLFLGAFPE